MPCADKQSHNRQIIEEKEQQRLFKIEKDELGLQKQIAWDIPLPKGINAVQRNAGAQDPQRIRRARDGEPQSLPARPIMAFQ